MDHYADWLSPVEQFDRLQSSLLCKLANWNAHLMHEVVWGHLRTCLGEGIRQVLIDMGGMRQRTNTNCNIDAASSKFVCPNRKIELVCGRRIWHMGAMKRRQLLGRSTSTARSDIRGHLLHVVELSVYRCHFLSICDEIHLDQEVLLSDRIGGLSGQTGAAPEPVRSLQLRNALF